MAGGLGEVYRAVDTAVDVADNIHDAAKAVDTVNDVGKAVDIAADTKKASERAAAVRKAWKMELDDVKNGGTGISRAWSNSEKIELINNGKVSGYHGHHMKSVKGYPDLAGDPNNIQFLTPTEHLDAHGGSWRNISHGRYTK